MERYRKSFGRDPPHQSLAREENLERQGGRRKRWRSPQEATFGEMKRKGRKVAEWMEQSLMELVLIELGSLYSLEIRMREQC